jgi:hypothetical protein
MGSRSNQRILGIVIPVLALADGVLHFLLDFILFRGNLFGSPFRAGPPPGSAPRAGAAPPRAPANPLILPLNELFLLNFVGSVILVALYLLSRRLLGERRWVVDVVLILYAATTFTAWWIFGRPNPMNLGYLSKGIEIVLIVALIADIRSILRSRPAPAPAT